MDHTGVLRRRGPASHFVSAVRRGRGEDVDGGCLEMRGHHVEARLATAALGRVIHTYIA